MSPVERIGAEESDGQSHRKRVTIREVARASGVSATTVSVVLNGTAAHVGIREATRRSVLRNANRLGYTPNRAARSLRWQRTNVLMLLVQDLANPWFIDLAVAARTTAVARGYELNIVDAGPFEAEMRALGHLRGGSADAVIVATGRHGSRAAALDALQDLVEHGVPAVMLIDRSPDPQIPAIRVDVEGGAYRATRHLLQLGHRRIGHLTLAGAEPIESEVSSRGERYRGYRRALSTMDVAFDTAWLIEGRDSLAGGRTMLQALLALGERRPSAILVYNDLTAIGAMHGLYEAGLRMPEDMAVIGTDGIELGAYTTPPLTSVEHPGARLGQLAIETAIDLLGGSVPAETDRVLETRLIVRASCGGGSPV